MPENFTIVFSRIHAPEEQFDVSVVIPVYNGAATLAEQLLALSGQDVHRAFEVVLADNGSTDNTREVALRWADRFKAFTIVDASQARGAGHARNQGARVARGEKLLFCDADDVVCPEWVRVLSAALDAKDAVGGRVRLDRINPHDSVRGQEFEVNALNTVFGFLPYPLAGSLGVKRDAFLDIGGFDLAFSKGHEEADFGWRLQLAGHTLGWCPEAVVDYRQRANSYGTGKQYFNYAKSSMLLWSRYAKDYPLAPVSFRGSLVILFRRMLKFYELLLPRHRRNYARSLGWSAGVAAGHLHYRFLGRPPETQVMHVEARRR